MEMSLRVSGTPGVGLTLVIHPQFRFSDSGSGGGCDSEVGSVGPAAPSWDGAGGAGSPLGDIDKDNQSCEEDELLKHQEESSGSCWISAVVSRLPFPASSRIL